MKAEGGIHVRLLRVRRRVLNNLYGLLAASLFLGAGCIPIPLIESPRTPSGKQVRWLVGDHDSRRPIRVGMTDRSEALAELGTPYFATPKQRAVGYTYVVADILWLSPLNLPIGFDPSCFFPPFEPATYYLFLDFDDSAKLHRFELHRIAGWQERGASAGDDLWHKFLEQVPDKDSATTRPAPQFNGTWFERPRSSPL